MMTESNVLKRIMLACSRGKSRLFRNNTGMSWVGTGAPVRTLRPITVTLMPGDVLLRKARPFHAGLCKGGSDLIGWQSVTITPEMVGKLIARFIAFEGKTDKGRPSSDQINFIDAVNNSGGLGAIVRSETEALDLLQNRPVREFQET
jgi:hypothetical protein